MTVMLQSKCKIYGRGSLFIFWGLHNHWQFSAKGQHLDILGIFSWNSYSVSLGEKEMDRSKKKVPTCLYWCGSALIFGGEWSGQSWPKETTEGRTHTFFFAHTSAQSSSSKWWSLEFPLLFLLVLLWEKEEYKNGHYMFSVCVWTGHCVGERENGHYM